MHTTKLRKNEKAGNQMMNFKKTAAAIAAIAVAATATVITVYAANTKNDN